MLVYHFPPAVSSFATGAEAGKDITRQRLFSLEKTGNFTIMKHYFSYLRNK